MPFGFIGGILSVAKASTVLDGGWRYAGGASIVFHALEEIDVKLVGKTIRTIEYPDGDLVTVQIRSNNLSTLKNAILKGQTPIYPGVELREDEVQQIARWTPPCFTEPVLTRKDLKLVPDGGWIFWSRFTEEIPKRGVTLEFRGREEERQDGALKFVASLARSMHPEEKLSRREEELLTDLVVDRDEGILTLYRNFHQKPAVFNRHVLRYLRRKNLLKDYEPPTKIALETMTEAQRDELKERVRLELQQELELKRQKEDEEHEKKLSALRELREAEERRREEQEDRRRHEEEAHRLDQLLRQQADERRKREDQRLLAATEASLKPPAVSPSSPPHPPSPSTPPPAPAATSSAPESNKPPAATDSTGSKERPGWLALWTWFRALLW